VLVTDPLLSDGWGEAVKRIYVIEDLCSGCRICEAFCSSLQDGVFDAAGARVRVIKTLGELRDIPLVDCAGLCVRPIYDDGRPTCVALCPTGALVYEEQADAARMRRELEAARAAHALFKVIAPWKWPFPWRRFRPGAPVPQQTERDP
jgi:Fe-S-cluster-containing dehydrogenase component